MKQMKSIMVAHLLLFLAGGFGVLAQSTTDTIAGMVMDERQADITGASVLTPNQSWRRWMYFAGSPEPD